jgi:hypothetical protein
LIAVHRAADDVDGIGVGGSAKGRDPKKQQGTHSLQKDGVRAGPGSAKLHGAGAGFAVSENGVFVGSRARQKCHRIVTQFV